MQYFTSHAIRALFLDYFSRHNHTIVPSAPLIPGNDPSLLFVNAGMVPFKDVFLGRETRDYILAASSQRCLRVGGKHNDLDQVGFTPRHHTLFDMLGNFSFGGYFKKEAIKLSWRFLTDVLKLPKEKLWVSVHTSDDEAYAVWVDDIQFPEDRIRRIGDADNFWSMGDVGPCGPCSEIFYDLGASLAGGPPGSPEQDGPRYMEIWNIVFMQYERHADGHKYPLAKPCVDTGMGLERIAAVLQGVHDTYDTDQFKELIAILRQYAKKPLERHVEKILSDHARSSIMLICDGIRPSAEGRGYVLRRLIRRALRYAYQAELLIPFLSSCSDAMIDAMGTVYTHVFEYKDIVRSVLHEEELQFSRTLKSGMHLLYEAIKDIPSGASLDASIVFKLYDTYGFPVDLTETVLKERGLLCNMGDFERLRNHQKKQSQAHTHFHSEASTQVLEHPETVFTGYDTLFATPNIIGLYTFSESKLTAVKLLQAGEKGYVVLDHTPFYAESGGQVGDKGTLENAQTHAAVLDTQYQGSIILHHIHIHSGVFHLHDTVTCHVDTKRFAISQHHSATHLLHAALRAKYGNEVQQKGSLVEAHRLRFDFSCTENLTPEALDHLSAWINDRIAENIPMSLEHTSPHEAIAQGAIGLFADNYKDTVRVISFSETSRELCGGTHVKNTADIGCFYITSYSSIAAHVRRIEAIVGRAVLERLTCIERWKNDIINLCQVEDTALADYIQHTQHTLKHLTDLTETLRYEKYIQSIDTLIHNTSNTLPVIFSSDATASMMLRIIDYAKTQTKQWIICLGTPSALGTPLVCGHNTATKEATDAFVQTLQTLSPLKAGIKPGLIRGVIMCEVTDETLLNIFKN